MTGIDHFYVGRRHRFGCKKAGKIGRNSYSVMDDNLAIIGKRETMTRALQLHLHYIWGRGKPRKLIRASPAIKLARPDGLAPGSRLANKGHWVSLG
jgi:hypothetical protein